MENLAHGEITPARFRAEQVLREVQKYANAEQILRLKPHQLRKQLEIILDEWVFLSEPVRQEIKSALAALIDEDNYFLHQHKTGAGHGGIDFPQGYSAPGLEARYSNDYKWMHALVLVAKNALVWMHQLAKKYGITIQKLSDIPDAELAYLANQGITGIWLIGIWQRSAASQKIKRSMGAKGALASAYSLYDYQISDALGGENTFTDLKTRAWQHGIRLGSDMVPNHTGIDSACIAEHPDWFLQTEKPPYTAYSFSRENLSADARYELRIEDHYYDKTDAAVVFEHVDTASGKRRYIYHGNDGTSMPWNDTAQLNFALDAVRHAVIEQILQVAELTPIIRFDAAMTLTRKHFKRLWFGAGSDAIASRRQWALSDADFSRLMPQEFWREVVAAVQEKFPETLLLAEAFWFTEPFFVKELGMHRVYNSAFMHMLRDENNAKFRRGLIRALADEPQILKRYTNFMNNPDEDSAATQFGKGDKYFGVTTLMVTLPGLPMLGHGQIEGLSEKYGMEFEKPLRDEKPDAGFIARHETEIFPLLRQRAHFAPVENLTFFSLSEYGHTHESVYAYVTGGTSPHLILFNNQYQAVRGSLATAETDGRHLLDVLCIPQTDFFSCKELKTGQEHQFDAAVILEHGLSIALGGYETKVYSNFELRSRPVKESAPMSTRIAGLSLPVFSMRSAESCGIGEFADIEKLIPFMQSAGLRLLYILPVNDTGENPSPYSAVSAFALNPVFIRLEALPGAAAFTAEIEAFRTEHAKDARIKYRDVYLFKEEMLRKIFSEPAEGTDDWIKENPWIEGYSRFKKLTPSPSLEKSGKEMSVLFYASVQMHLANQLIAAKNTLEGAGIMLKGDLPIMLERNSADVYDNPDLFDMQFVAGAPPDMFSATGQNWGFPIYNWKRHLETGLQWWKNRVKVASRYFHAYRIDHVLGFFRIWSIAKEESSGLYGVFNPSHGVSEADLIALGFSATDIHFLSTPAADGSRPLIWRDGLFYFSWTWKDAPQLQKFDDTKRQALEKLHRETEAASEREREELGRRLLTELKKATQMIVCAEDLGVVPYYVPLTLESLGIYGLRVDRWSRHYQRDGQPLYKPDEFPKLSIAMSSVHDSSTLRGYLTDERRDSVQYVRDALGSESEPSASTVEELLHRLFATNANICLIPFQDFYAMLDKAWKTPAALELINIPGQVLDANWSYCLPMPVEALQNEHALAEKIRKLIQGSGR